MADESPFRLFEVTFSVHIPKEMELPVTANEWQDRVNMNAALERVIERRYPLAKDIIERRDEEDTYRYG